MAKFLGAISERHSLWSVGGITHGTEDWQGGNDELCGSGLFRSLFRGGKEEV